MLLGQGPMHPAPGFQSDLPQFPRQPLRLRLALADESPIPSPPTVVREAQEGEGRGATLPEPLSAQGWKPTEFDQPRLLRVELQGKLPKAFLQSHPQSFCIVPVLKAHHESSRAGESHPHPLTEPDVNVSTHPALTIQPSPETT